MTADYVRDVVEDAITIAAARRLLDGLEAKQIVEALPVLGLGLILLGVVVVHAPTLNDPFHGDDFVAFTEFKVKSFFEYSRDVFLFKDENFYWRPLGDIVHYSFYAAFGFDEFAFRVAALAVFLVSLICLYVFCIGERLGAWTALAAVLVFGLFPNHVVSVTWVTNTSRLMAVLFVLLSLLALQVARGRRFAFGWELGAFIFLVAATLSDETSAALVPVPVLYATFVGKRQISWRGDIARLIGYAVVVAIVIPLQLEHTLDDETRLTQYGLGPHVETGVWALSSQLVLPLASGSPVDAMIQRLPPAEWAAGLVGIAAGAIGLVLGSRTTRFLVIWMGLSLAPFALWEPQYMSPRYVYMAAVPFAMLVSWTAVQIATWLMASAARIGPVGRPLRIALGTTLASTVVALIVISARADHERNAVWSAETAKYGVLRSGVERQMPRLQPGARLIVIYGEWPDFWATAVAKSITGDRSIRVTSIPRERADQTTVVSQTNDVVLFLMRDRLMPSALRH